METWHVLLLLLLLLHTCWARMRPAEREALVALYAATDGGSWLRKEHWTTNNAIGDPCRAFSKRLQYRFNDYATTPFVPGARIEATPWHGVGCIDPCDDYLDGPGCTAGRVTGLALRNNSLRGSLTGWHGVGQMTNLTHLDMSHNLLSGVLPTQLGRINHVDLLSFRANQISGLLPPELARVNSNGVGSLRELSINLNRISGTLPSELGLHAASLQLLDVKVNRLSGTIPQQVGQLQRLEALQLQNNSLSGTIPVDFGLVPATGGGGSGDGGDGLMYDAPPAPPGGLQHLRYLELHNNARLSGTLPPSLQYVGLNLGLAVPEMRHSLRHLHLGSARLSGTIPTELGRLTELTSLKLDANRLSGTIPSELGLLRKLETLDLYDNPLQGDVPSELARLINIRLFYIPNQNLRPLRTHYCGQRLPNVGKYNYRIVREEFMRMATSICPEPLDTLGTFGTLAALSGDI